MTQHLADRPDTAPAADPARTHRLAVLALVLAIVVPPVGVVLGVLVLRQGHRERRDTRLAVAALVVAVLVLLGELLLLILLTAGSPAPSATAAAPSPEPSAAGSSAANPGTEASGSAAADPHGVAAACAVVMPALGQVRTDVGKVKSADQYGEVLTQLATTIVTGAGATTDQVFLDHVGRLSQAFQKAWQDSSNGTAPSAVADQLTAAGAPVSRDCAAAGYHP